MTETVLGIRIKVDGTGKVTADLGGVSKEIKQVGTTSEKSTKQATGFGSALKGLAVAATVREIIGTIVTYEKLSASLKTVVGSAEGAKQAFSAIKAFAASTPFEVTQVTEAFVRLKSLGLDASIGSLTSYGNTAAAMGKDIMQFIEAVADASTGEFERLKDFGVKASVSGDQVAFRFQGVTTKIKNNAADIEKYLQGLGNNQFATGMSDQMDTLGGKFSNTQDAVAQLFAAMGESGGSGVVGLLADSMTGLAQALTAVIQPTDDNLKNTTKLGGALKTVAFIAYETGQAFKNLGDFIGFASAVAAASFQAGFAEKFKTMRAEREAFTAQLEKDTEQFVGRMEGIIKTPISVISPASPLTPPTKGPTDTELKKAAAAAKEFKKELQGITDELDPLSKVTREYNAQQAVLDQALKSGNISAERHAQLTALLKQSAQEAAAGLDKEAIALKDLQTTLDSFDPLDSLRKKMLELEIALEEFPDRAAEINAAIEKVGKQMDEQQDKTNDKTKVMEEISKRAAGNMQQAFADFLFDPFDKGLGGMLDGFINVIKRMVAEAAAAEIFKSLFGSTSGGTGSGVLSDFFGNFIKSLAFHEGGIVGLGGSPRLVSPLVFAGAPRYHNGGLAGDEVPAILKRGEEVLTANDPRHRNNASAADTPPIKVVIENKGTPQQATAGGASFDGEGFVVKIVTQDVARGGPISGALSRVFGLNRGG